MRKETLRNLKHDNDAALAAQRQPSLVVDNDSKLAQDHGTDRAHFQGRFRATTFGDFKNRPGYAPEMVAAQIEYHEREDAAREAAETSAAITDAAAQDGVIVEDDPIAS